MEHNYALSEVQPFLRAKAPDILLYSEMSSRPPIHGVNARSHHRCMMGEVIVSSLFKSQSVPSKYITTQKSPIHQLYQ